jgi:hypothetical protein
MARIVEGVEPALVGGELFGIGTLVCDDEGHDQEHEADAERNRDEDREGQVILHQ